MSFRETTSLLANDAKHDYRIRNTYLRRFHWRSVLLATCAGLIPVLLWIAIFQNLDDPMSTLPQSSSSPEQPNVLKLSSSSSLLAAGAGKKFSPQKKSKSEKVSPITSKPAKSNLPNPNPSYSTIGNKTVVTYYLEVTEGHVCPDNFPQMGFLVNGQSPGPEIRVKQYSILVVHVTNKLSTPVTFHFHGIHQRRSFLCDGVPNVTQKPIPPGGTFNQTFNTWPQVGTFFYHAHTAMDIVWIYGALIIEDDLTAFTTVPDAYQYDDDRVFILNGVYHEALTDLMDRIAGPIHSYPTIIASITLNGKSFGLWGKGNDTAYETSGYHVTTVQKGLRYRFRFINAASDSLLTCKITSHTFTVIETDGIYVVPVETDRLVISPGQRYSIIVTMDQPENNYYIYCKHMESAGPLNGLAIMNYENAPKPGNEMLRYDCPGNETMPLDWWIMDKLAANAPLDQTDFYQVPKNVDREFVIDVFEAVIVQRHVYLINGHYYEEPTIPYYMQLQQGVNISNPPQVFEILLGESIQFVFQNQRTGTFCFSHPWHIHGHSFHVVGQGSDRYNPEVDGPRIQKDVLSGKQFQLRDSVTVYANQTIGEETDGAFCGWTAVRFAAHNPGLWLAHCHVTPHMIMGKKFVIWEHPVDDPYLTEVMNGNILSW